MQKLYIVLQDLLLICQFLACIIGAFYLVTQKRSYWIWFSIYLAVIFVQEFFWAYNPGIERHYRTGYYVFFGVPLEYLFLYWLYAQKSLKNSKLFRMAISIFLVVVYTTVFFKEIDEVFSISINVGTILLMIFVIMEFIKQIRTDNILNFRENRMFYINIGLILFYIGNYPFHILGPELYKNYLEIWNIYYVYFLVTNCLMYLLFSVSFIWGKTH